MGQEIADLTALLKAKKKGKKQSVPPPSQAKAAPKKRGAPEALAATTPARKKSKRGQALDPSGEGSRQIPVNVTVVGAEEIDGQLVATRQKRSQPSPPGGFPTAEQARWKPKLARSDRPVYVNDHAASPETANALAEALMLPKDMERNRGKSGEALVREAVRHLVMAAQEVKTLGDKYAAQESGCKALAKKNLDLLQRLSAAETSSLKHKKQVAQAVKDMENAKLALTAAEEKNAELAAALEKCKADLEKTRADAEQSRDDGIKYATEQYISQLIGIQDGQYSAGWVAALQAAEVPEESHLFANIPVPSTWSDSEDAAEDAEMVAEVAAEDEENAAEEAGDSHSKETDFFAPLVHSEGLVDPGSSREAGEMADQMLRDAGLHMQKLDKQAEDNEPGQPKNTEARDEDSSAAGKDFHLIDESSDVDV